MILTGIRKDETLSLYGCLLTYRGTEKDTAILWDVRKEKVITYGRKALDKILARAGWELID